MIPLAGKTRTRRRSPGEGGAYSYKTGTGERWYWKATVTQPDGSVRQVARRGFETKKAAQDAMREALLASSRGGYAEPSKQTTGAYLAGWLLSLRLAPATMASYRKNVRLHITPYIGEIPLASLTSTRITRLYRELESGGRRDGRGELEGAGLSARTVRYVATILHKALAEAVAAEPPLIPRNPAAKAKPPTAAEARPPEMHPWNAAQLSAFLGWSARESTLHAAWYVLANTGMRRGELLDLQWRDFTPGVHAGTISIRRSVGVVRNAGEGAQVVSGPTKTGTSRVVDLDPATVEILRAWKRERGALALSLARDDALIFGDLEGGHLHPERFSRTWHSHLNRCRDELGADAPPVIRLHDLRHTHATLLLSAGEPVKTVQERLGHRSPTITMTVYAHALPGDQSRAASRFAALLDQAQPGPRAAGESR